jgi:hypothetical protein
MKTKPKCSLLATKVGWRIKDAAGRILTITEIDDCGYRWCDRMGKNRYLQKFTCAGDPLLNAALDEYAVKVFPPVGQSRRGKFVGSRFAGDAPVELIKTSGGRNRNHRECDGCGSGINPGEWRTAITGKHNDEISTRYFCARCNPPNTLLDGSKPPIA